MRNKMKLSTFELSSTKLIQNLNQLKKKNENYLPQKLQKFRTNMTKKRLIFEDNSKNNFLNLSKKRKHLFHEKKKSSNAN